MSENEKDIIEAVRGGDAEAYAGLVHAHQARVRLVCLSYLANLSEADDAAQDVFIKAYEKLASFKGEAAFGTWISHIASNHCLDLLRTRQRRQTDSLDAIFEANGDHLQVLMEPDPNRVHTPEDLELLGKVLSALPNEEREILLLREVEELSYDQIASKLQCTLDAVKGRLKRARQRLQDNFHGKSDTSGHVERP